MSSQDPADNPFAPEFSHLHELVTQAETKLRNFDLEMSRAGDTPTLNFNPPNPMGGGTAPARRSRVDIQRDKDETKANAYKSVEKATEAAEPGLKKQMQDIAFGRLYREDIEKLKDADRGLASPTVSWSLDKMQVRAMVWLKEDRDKQRANPKPTPSSPDKTSPNPKQPEKDPEVTQNEPQEPDPSPDWEPEI